jgi:hypothetical protein
MDELNHLKRRIEFLEGILFRFAKDDRYLFSRDFQLFDGVDMQLGTTTGSKIGTTTTQKLGFFGETPVAQQAAITAPSGGTVADAIDSSARSKINEIRTALSNLGLTA